MIKVRHRLRYWARRMVRSVLLLVSCCPECLSTVNVTRTGRNHCPRCGKFV